MSRRELTKKDLALAGSFLLNSDKIELIERATASRLNDLLRDSEIEPLNVKRDRIAPTTRNKRPNHVKLL